MTVVESFCVVSKMKTKNYIKQLSSLSVAVYQNESLDSYLALSGLLSSHQYVHHGGDRLYTFNNQSNNSIGLVHLLNNDK